MSKHIIDDMNSVPETCNKHKTAMYWYGDWYCSDCQKEEEYAYQESEARWYSQSALCQRCMYSNCGEFTDKCSEYNMPLYMVARKKKCKHYKEYIEQWD
jgi:hypothetical protein